MWPCSHRNTASHALQLEPQDKKVVVFGDTHGQLQDVLKMLRELKAYSSNDLLVFNGATGCGADGAMISMQMKCLFDRACFQETEYRCAFC